MCHRKDSMPGTANPVNSLCLWVSNCREGGGIRKGIKTKLQKLTESGYLNKWSSWIPDSELGKKDWTDSEPLNICLSRKAWAV